MSCILIHPYSVGYLSEEEKFKDCAKTDCEGSQNTEHEAQIIGEKSKHGGDALDNYNRKYNDPCLVDVDLAALAEGDSEDRKQEQGEKGKGASGQWKK